MGDIGARATGFPEVSGCSPSLSWEKSPKYCWDVILPNFFLSIFEKKKILPGIFCELNLTNLAANLFCKNRRSRSVCFILVKFHFTRARQPVPKIVSLGREASTSSLTRISSYS